MKHTRFTVSKLKAMPYIGIDNVSVNKRTLQYPDATVFDVTIETDEPKTIRCYSPTEAVAYANSLLEGGK